jgi:hypothetical protein
VKLLLPKIPFPLQKKVENGKVRNCAGYGFTSHCEISKDSCLEENQDFVNGRREDWEILLD